MGETGTGEGEGVRAKRLKGICPTDFLRLGEWRVLVFTPSLCLRPCKLDGRVLGEVTDEAGEHGVESTGLDDSDGLDESLDVLADERSNNGLLPLGETPIV